MSGSFVLGFLVAAFAHRFVVHPDLRIAVTVGFLGAYTTFSTLTLETFEFAETRAWGWATTNIALSVAAGLGAVWLGTLAGASHLAFALSAEGTDQDCSVSSWARSTCLDSGEPRWRR